VVGEFYRLLHQGRSLVMSHHVLWIRVQSELLVGVE
jgi:hypothetical protein